MLMNSQDLYRFAFRRVLAKGCVFVALALATSALAAESGAKTNAAHHWAFQPISRPAIPEAARQQGVVRTRVDNFIFRELAKHKLTPAPEADRASLIRRLYFDLVGLPPSPEDVAAFISDTRPDAYEQLVERLLALPQ